jgi:hypothetical protein
MDRGATWYTAPEGVLKQFKITPSVPSLEALMVRYLFWFGMVVGYFPAWLPRVQCLYIAPSIPDLNARKKFRGFGNFTQGAVAKYLEEKCFISRLIIRRATSDNRNSGW